MSYGRDGAFQMAAGVNGQARAPAASRTDALAAPDQVLVLGLGNTLLTDDAAGVLVVEGLQQAGDLPDRIRLLDGGTLSFTLLAAITDATGLVVVDAARMGAPPGTVRCFMGAAMDDFLAHRQQYSVHELGLTELLDMARLQDRLPESRVLVAIEPQNLEWGVEPTAAIAAALPEAMARVRDWTAEWLIA